MATAAVMTLSARLATDLVMAMLGQGQFTPGRPEGKPALGVLYDGLSRQLREQAQIILLTGRPTVPQDFFGWGFGPARKEFAELLPSAAPPSLLQHFAGSWRDRRLLLLSLRHGLARQEFDQLFHLLTVVGDKGPVLRKRWLEEQMRGNLPHATLLFADDLRDLGADVSWPVQVALGWLQRDLNMLSRLDGLPAAAQAARRQGLFDAVLGMVSGIGEQCELLANLDRIIEDLHNYDRDEFACLLLARFDPRILAEVCLGLCGLIERLQQRIEQVSDAVARERIEPVRWITRRVAELLVEDGHATPAHYHALVLQKVLLYEEIPGDIRARVAALQVLTSFLANPQRYFAEIEGSHSPEVLEKRLWRLLEMLPNMLRAYRFDAAREVVAFAQRFGPTFDLSRNAELLTQVRETAAEVLATGETVQQSELMKALPQMGRTGLHLLIDLADHSQRSVRRVALDGLCAAGPAVVPVLFEALESKSGWHYLRNMLVILGKVGAVGPKVESFYRRALEHPEAGIRKEALPGAARLLRENAADLVAERLADPDPEVRRRAVTCLGMTGITAPQVYDRLAEFLSPKGADDMALAVVATVNRLRPGERAGTRVEAALIELVGGGWFGLGKGAADRTLRMEAIRALGQFPSPRARKVLDRLLKDNDGGVARAAQEALVSGP
ncbi:MAG: HEAT repeat domain-containing protein [Desulfuromonadales bacterium]|nr:HEAT repeat domain-containing protein [Desulfuromonadales bacterium]